jgi:hypothetical protein
MTIVPLTQDKNLVPEAIYERPWFFLLQIAEMRFKTVSFNKVSLYRPRFIAFFGLCDSATAIPRLRFYDSAKVDLDILDDILLLLASQRYQEH